MEDTELEDLYQKEITAQELKIQKDYELRDRFDKLLALESIITHPKGLKRKTCPLCNQKLVKTKLPVYLQKYGGFEAGILKCPNCGYEYVTYKMTPFGGIILCSIMLLVLGTVLFFVVTKG